MAKYSDKTEICCPQCGNKFRIHFNNRKEEIAFCAFCGDDIFIRDENEDLFEEEDTADEDDNLLW